MVGNGADGPGTVGQGAVGQGEASQGAVWSGEARRGAARCGMAKLTVNLLRSHRVYRNAAGDKLSGVTTVLGILAKPALLDWAHSMGLQGLDYKMVRDRAADTGTICHAMIEAHLRGMEFDHDGLAPNMLEAAAIGLGRFKAWWNQSRLTMVKSECPMVSEAWQVGGTADCVALRPDGESLLIDVKSGKAIYKEMRIQVAVYSEMYNECYGVRPHPVIVRVGREAKDDLEVEPIGEVEQAAAVELFGHLAKVHRLLREIRG